MQGIGDLLYFVIGNDLERCSQKLEGYCWLAIKFTRHKREERGGLLSETLLVDVQDEYLMWSVPSSGYAAFAPHREGAPTGHSGQ